MSHSVRSLSLTGLALASAVLVASCRPGLGPATQTATQVALATGAPTTASTPTATPTSAPTTVPTVLPSLTIIAAAPTTSVTAASGTSLRLDLDAIFPMGPGRDLVLNDCTVCHTFLRIVVGRRTRDQWDYVRRDMRGKVSQLSDQDVDTLFAYLEANFNDTKPVPALPDWFLQTGEW